MPNEIKCIRLKKKFKTNSLLKDLASAEKHFARLNKPEHLKIIKGRASVLSILKSTQAPTLSVNKNPAPLPALPEIQKILKGFKSPLYNVRIMRLYPGSQLHSHRDPDRSFAFGVVRYLIPIECDPEIEFIIEDKKIDISPGELWWIDVSREHTYINRSKKIGTLLIIELGVSLQMMRQFPLAFQKEIKKEISYDEKTKHYYAPKLNGQYQLPRNFAKILPLKSGRNKAALSIITDSKKKTCFKYGNGLALPLVIDKYKRIRIKGIGPGLSFTISPSGLRLERRGIIHVNDDGKVSLYTLSTVLKKLPGVNS